MSDLGWRRIRVLAACLAAGGVLGGGALADEANSDPITLERIMADPDWIGHPPEDAWWADDSRTVFYYQERTGDEGLVDLYRLDLATGQVVLVPPEGQGQAGAEGGAFSPDRRQRVFLRSGDVFLSDLESGQLRQLTRTADAEAHPYFLADGRHIVFERDGTLFVRDLESGLESQPADLRLEEDPDEEEEDEDLLAREQLRLFDILRLEKRRAEALREQEESEQQGDPTRTPVPWYLGEDLEILEQTLSPQGDWLLLVVRDVEPEEGQADNMPAYVTRSGYVESQEVRTKVGTGEPVSERVLLLDLASREQHELDLAALPGLGEDPLAELRLQAKQREEARQAEKESTAKDEDEDKEEDEDEDDLRSVDVQDIRWSPDGRYAALRLHSSDNKDRWIAVVEREKPELRPVHRLTDPGWINWSFNEYDWLPDGDRLWFLSEESGWSHLYLHSVGSGKTRQLTRGEQVVDDVEMSRDGRYLYFNANLEHPGVYEIFRVAVDGVTPERGAPEQLTRLGGVNSAQVSPDGRSLLVTHSTTTVPPELYLQAAEPGATARRLTHTVSDAFTSLPWIAPQIVAIPSSEGSRPVYARLFLPPAGHATPDAQGQHPAAIFIHGAGYLQNSHQGWSSYFREFMFHTFLARRGYVVLDLDYRGSAGYGRDWRTAIYRQMGTPEVVDLADSIAWLAAEHGVDRQRVGAYGGSYGGFLTLMALFKEPELLACGAALRPVTDWAHYNHEYTSNILNTPELDPEAYTRSSPIEFAAGLSKPLLMCSGMQDDNVFFQDTVRLVQRLIELEKEDWEVAIYPIEDHGFDEPSSWLDEYRRVFKLFETHLRPDCP